MWILADENIDRPIVAWLRGQGHDVVEAATAAPEAADADLIAMSRRAGRILITCAPTPHARVPQPGEVARFQEPVGFWLWEPAGGTVVLTRAVPRKIGLERAWQTPRLMKRIEIIGVLSFDPLLALEGPGADKLAGAALLVNAAIPQFNCPIIELGSDQICRISSEHRKELEIESIDLYLLEDIDADAVILSWAPAGGGRSGPGC